MGQHPPGKFAKQTPIGQQHAKPVAFGIDCQTGHVLPAGAPLAGFQIERLRLAFDNRIKAALALVAGKALFDLRIDQIVFRAHLVKGIALRQDGAQRTHHIGHQIDADQIIETEGAGLGNAHRAAEDRIGILDVDTQFHRLMDCRLHGEDANPVAEKARRVGTSHDALAQCFVIVARQNVDHRILGFLAAHQFQ